MSSPGIQSESERHGIRRLLQGRLFAVAAIGAGIAFLLSAAVVSATLTGADAPVGERAAPFIVAFLCWAIATGAIVSYARASTRSGEDAARLAAFANTVAAGDLSVGKAETRHPKFAQVAHALNAMVDSLANMAFVLRQAALETAAMAGEITASSTQMSASANQIATTAGQLSTQSASMAEGIQSLATSAGELVGLGRSLDTGAHEGVERSLRLRELAGINRAKLDESSGALDALAKDVERNAAATEGLARASEEVRSFVSLVGRLARQSKLLALNAAMEAARAGDHGQGFAVVADEVRRLAAMSSEGAEKTARVVADILQAVEASRESSARTVSTVHEVRAATRQGSTSFDDIELEVFAMGSWIAAVERAATSANSLVGDMTSRLDQLARGTETFAAAMEQVAASSEQQSGSTQEIAAAAATLSASAERLSGIVANLRMADRRPGHRTATPGTGTALTVNQRARSTRSSTSSSASRPATV
ncbi:MAG: methyl-accepting chemotaxis protein [Gemmatimonadaceae bacterium]